MLVCLVSRHTHDDTTKRRPRNGTVGPEIAIFTTANFLDPNIQILPPLKNTSLNITYPWSAIFFYELVLGKDRLVCGCHFYGTLRRRDGARLRSFAES